MSAMVKAMSEVPCLRNLRLSTDAAVTSAVASTPGSFALSTLATPPP